MSPPPNIRRQLRNQTGDAQPQTGEAVSATAAAPDGCRSRRRCADAHRCRPLASPGLLSARRPDQYARRSVQRGLRPLTHNGKSTRNTPCRQSIFKRLLIINLSSSGGQAGVIRMTRTNACLLVSSAARRLYCPCQTVRIVPFIKPGNQPGFSCSELPGKTLGGQ